MQKITFAAFVVLVLAGSWPPGARAGAASGLGLFITSASVVTMDAATEQEYAKATFGAGGDYQHAFNESFSLGISVDEIVGDAMFPTLPDVTTHKVSSLELEARVWLGSLFLGYHRGTFILTTAEGFGSPEISGGKPGDGYTLGLESESGWFAVAQTVRVKEIEVENAPPVAVEGYRIRFGFRWR